MSTFCSQNGFPVPIILGPIGNIAGPDLIAAVSNAGGLGTYTLCGFNAKQTNEDLTEIRRLTVKPILVAFVGEWEPDDNIEILRKHNVTMSSVFWWNGPRLLRKLQNAGIKVFWHVGTQSQLIDAVALSPDAILTQGYDAGGHVRSNTSLTDLIMLAKQATTLPIVAAGGINTPERAKYYIDLGADTIMLGTRLAATFEARGTATDKELICMATSKDLMLDKIPSADWPSSFRRRLTSGGNLDIPARYANSNVDEITTTMFAKDVIDWFARFLG